MLIKADIRRERLRKFIDEHCSGNAAECARRADKSESQINDMLAGRKSFGEKVARSMEEKLGLPEHWLDGEPSDAEALAKEILACSQQAREAIAWIIERDKATRNFTS